MLKEYTVSKRINFVEVPYIENKQLPFLGRYQIRLEVICARPKALFYTLDKSVLVENSVKVSESNCENTNKCIF